MRVKTITCHEVYNHGATLQEYALLKYLEKLGHEAEAIHYKPPYLSGHLKLWTVSNPKYNNFILKWPYLLLKLPTRIINLKRKRAFDNFSKKHIQVGEYRYSSNQELKDNLPKADAYICGSDQIWNSYFQNGKDPSFYLDFAPEKALKISYAASFAIDEIEDDLKDFVGKSISRLNAVSVRETSGLNILKGLGISKGVQVLDPVFLLTPDFWKTNFIREIREDYLFIYDFDSNVEIKRYAQELATKYNLRIYSVNKNIAYSDKNFWLEGPETFLSLLYNAKIVLTNSFHAVAFSVIFSKQLYVFNRNVSINTRMRDLLGLVDLGSIHENNPRESSKISIKPISNYVEVNKKLQTHIDRSKLFIEKALS